MYRHNIKVKTPSNMFWKATTAVFALTSILLAFIALQCSEPSLMRVYSEFNYLKVYEDGSFHAQDRKTGFVVDGCIKDAFCED